MAIDPSIALQIRPVQFDNPLDSYNKFAQAQTAQNQNKLAGLVMQDRQRGIDDQAALTNALRSNMDQTTGEINHVGVVNELARTGSGHLVQGYQDKQLANQKTQADVGKIKAETQSKQVSSAQDMNKLFGSGAYAILQNPTYENAMKVHAQMRSLLPPEMAKNFDGSDIPQDPVALKEWANNHYLSAIDAEKQMADKTARDNAKLKSDTDIKTTGMTNSASIENNKRTTAATMAGQTQAERHFQAGQSAPQYMETDAGLVALPKKLAPGKSPVGTPVMGANGEVLGKPLKPIPATVNSAIIQNSQSVGQIDRALNLLKGNNQDGMTGDKSATGWKGYLPNGVLNRMDPQGVDARAVISDIGSLKIHDRSGAAVTISESPRLMPFIPLSTDDAATVNKKLNKLRVELANESQAMQEVYSKDQGYKPNPILSRTANSSPPAANGKTVARTGMSNGRKVVQYSDGTTDYAN